jgi:hypothetical protein
MSIGRLSKAEIGFKGLVSSIDAILSSWRPPTLRTELAYSDALADHLRAALPEDARVEREYRHEGTTCDLCVLYNGILSNDQLLIEVKRNLRKKADYDRLVGQIEGLKPKKNKIFLVLVGGTDPALIGRLREQFRSYLADDVIADARFRLVLVT